MRKKRGWWFWGGLIPQCTLHYRRVAKVFFPTVIVTDIVSLETIHLKTILISCTTLIARHLFFSIFQGNLKLDYKAHKKKEKEKKKKIKSLVQPLKFIPIYGAKLSANFQRPDNWIVFVFLFFFCRGGIKHRAGFAVNHFRKKAPS